MNRGTTKTERINAQRKKEIVSKKCETEHMKKDHKKQ